MAKHILPQLMQYGRVVRGYLGLHGRNIPVARHLVRLFGLTETHGVEVMAVEQGGPCDQAGLREGDIIIAFGDRPVTIIDDLHKRLTEVPVGVPASLVFLREERRLQRFVVPGEYPQHETQV
jgi:S1-C subfamily serine protease